MKIRHTIFLFLPPILLVLGLLFFRYRQAQPLVSAQQTTDDRLQTTSTPFIPVLPSDPILGDKQSGKTLVLFADFGCAHCQTSFSQLTELQKLQPRGFKIIWKGLPVTRFPFDSTAAHLAAWCAQKENKFSDFASLAFSRSADLTPPVLDSIGEALEISKETWQTCRAGAEAKQDLDTNIAIAGKLHIQAVPTLFLNGAQVETPSDISGWKNLLNL